MSSPTIEQALSLADSDTNKLNITFNGKQYKAGEKVPKEEATSAPSLTMTSLTEGTDSYVAICLDLDAPYQTLSIISPLIHWLQADLKSSSTGVLASPNSPIMDWLPVTPPPLSGPHRYTFLLYKQPENLDKEGLRKTWEGTGMFGRTRFDIDGFVKENGLTDMVAATYFENA